MRHPRERIVPKQDIAHGAAAERRHAAEQTDADPVHGSPARGERSSHGLNDNGDNVQRVKQHCACAPARRGAVAVLRTGAALRPLSPPPRFSANTCPRRESDHHEARLKGVRISPASLGSIVRAYQSTNWMTPPS
jgi:hypothetical protein